MRRSNPWRTYTAAFPLDDVFGHVLGEVHNLTERPEKSAIRLDFHESENELRISAEVPGVGPDAIDIQLKDDVLTLAIEKKDAHDGTQRETITSERHFGAFKRAVNLPFPVDAENIDARYEHGVLTITLAKASAARPTKIDIRTE